MADKDREKGRDFEPDRRNGQGAHEGKPHSPREFDVMNPARTRNEPDDDVQEQL